MPLEGVEPSKDADFESAAYAYSATGANNTTESFLRVNHPYTVRFVVLYTTFSHAQKQAAYHFARYAVGMVYRLMRTDIPSRDISHDKHLPLRRYSLSGEAYKQLYSFNSKNL